METTQDITSYAELFDLHLSLTLEDMAAQCQVDPSDLPEGVTAMVFFPDGGTMRCAAYVRDEKLFRFVDSDDEEGMDMVEEGEDGVPTTLEHLVDRGDPRG